MNLIDKDRFELAWIVDFPMYEYNEEDKKVDFSHNPFSMPQGGLEALQSQDPLTIKAFQYDIACNGYEIASGGIRNHRPEAMVKAFEIAGYGEKDVVERFGGMYRAFQYGAPPHGGMAAGVDRIVMLLCGTTNLREISLFPMNQQAVDLLMGAPSEVDAEAIARAAHPAQSAGQVARSRRRSICCCPRRALYLCVATAAFFNRIDPKRIWAAHQMGRETGASDIGCIVPYISVRHSHSTGPYR